MRWSWMHRFQNPPGKKKYGKGTYEHSDTFIQRDVNPVGIYGKVELILTEEGVLEDQTDLKYELDRM